MHYTYMSVTVFFLVVCGCTGEAQSPTGDAGGNDSGTSEPETEPTVEPAVEPTVEPSVEPTVEPEAQPDVIPEPEGSPEPDVGEPESNPEPAPEPEANPEPAPEPEPSPEPEPDVVPSSGCGTSHGISSPMSLSHDGLAREYQIHMPAGYDPNTAYPVVFSFHGRALTANSQIWVSGFDDLADTQGFIAVYPEGTGQSPTWNAGLCCGEAMQDDVDDVGFVEAIIDDLGANACIDKDRVYSTGLSNGAYMSFRLACELSDKIAGVGAIAGTTAVIPCLPQNELAVIALHGTADNIVPYDGVAGSLSAPQNAGDWAVRNNCSTSTIDTYAMGDVSCYKHTGCDPGAEVELCTVDGGGHQWFGGASIPFLGDNTDAIDASAYIWDFFEANAP